MLLLWMQAEQRGVGAWEVFYVVSGEGVLDDGTNEYPCPWATP